MNVCVALYTILYTLNKILLFVKRLHAKAHSYRRSLAKFDLIELASLLLVWHLSGECKCPRVGRLISGKQLSLSRLKSGD